MCNTLKHVQNGFKHAKKYEVCPQKMLVQETLFVCRIFKKINSWIETNASSNQTRRPGYAGPIWMNFSQNLDYFRPYKNQVEPGYKGHPIEFMVDFFRPVINIWDH